MADTIHPFEKAGLGKAPFKYRGIITRVCGADTTDPKTGIQTGATGQAAGTCNYCGMGIKYCCQIESADGQRFEVGTDCVEKLNRDDNRDVSALVQTVARDRAAIESANRRAAAANRKARENENKTATFAAFNENRAKFEALPHPNAHFAAQGKTLADYYDWIGRYAGHTGQMAAVKAIAAILAK